VTGRYLFDRFELDGGNRMLRRDGVPVEVSARYLDALILLVSEAGTLVTKDRFLQHVWGGVPVTDEALTQCIRTLRRQLGDDAARPRFIATVPKHGYRFIAAAHPQGAAADRIDAPASQRIVAKSPVRAPVWVLAGAGTLGAGAAGVVGGLFYGSAVASGQAGAGGASVLLVLLWLTIVAALVGGAGVSLGIAVAERAAPGWRIVGGAGGGFVVGGLVKLLGLDAFNLLLGHAPGDITGAPEGLVLGGAVGLGSWLAARRPMPLRRMTAMAGATGAAGAVAILLLGGRLMGGSLDLLARTFPGSRLHLDPLGRLFGEGGFGPVAQLATGALEGALFGACIVGAMALVRR